LRDLLREKKDAYWAEQADIQGQIATAWVLNAQGRRDEALEKLTAAAAAEDKTEKHPVTPGPLMPARELLGVMLLDRGMAKEALAAFEATLSKEPNRLGAAAGAARAAEKAGDPAKARQYYAKVAELTAEGGSSRPEAKEARAFLARTQ
jgi:tetratricopeptide (TPR) repeat protein